MMAERGDDNSTKCNDERSPAIASHRYVPHTGPRFSLRDTLVAPGKVSRYQGQAPDAEAELYSPAPLGRRAIMSKPTHRPRAPRAHRVIAIYETNDRSSKDTEPRNTSVAQMPPYSRAQQYLSELAKKRQLRAFVAEHFSKTDSAYVFFWQLKEGVRFPSERVISALESVIPRIEWFRASQPDEEGKK